MVLPEVPEGSLADEHEPSSVKVLHLVIPDGDVDELQAKGHCGGAGDNACHGPRPAPRKTPAGDAGKHLSDDGRDDHQQAAGEKPERDDDGTEKK